MKLGYMDGVFRPKTGEIEVDHPLPLFGSANISFDPQSNLQRGPDRDVWSSRRINHVTQAKSFGCSRPQNKHQEGMLVLARVSQSGVENFPISKMFTHKILPINLAVAWLCLLCD